MNLFIKNIVLFTLPILIVLAALFSIDFFKIFEFKHDYYTDNFIGVNRGMITTKTYNYLKNSEKYDSFIFGSSRSNAYHCNEWSKHLNDSAKPFHFDASNESIWGISKKIEYIDSLGEPIKNALLIIDRETLSATEMANGHLFISMPCISKKSKIDYYATFLRASINFRFLVSVLDYSIFKRHRKYMLSYIDISKDSSLFKTCDLIYGSEKLLKKDSIAYYKKMIEKNVFYDRSKKKDTKLTIPQLEVKQLQSIRAIFKKLNTNYKIVISPLYDQIPLENDQLQLFHDIFGKENVFNFSGSNKNTEPLTNYYESSHYKPFVANKIMREIYGKSATVD